MKIFRSKIKTHLSTKREAESSVEIQVSFEKKGWRDHSEEMKDTREYKVVLVTEQKFQKVPWNQVADKFKVKEVQNMLVH